MTRQLVSRPCFLAYPIVSKPRLQLQHQLNKLSKCKKNVGTKIIENKVSGGEENVAWKFPCEIYDESSEFLGSIFKTPQVGRM